jgi:hypothetical protein
MLRYSVGNEHSPTDPWGRSELLVDEDGTVRLDHHFSRVRREAAWTGVLTPAGLATLRGALDRSGFPAVPGGRIVPDTTLARVTVGEASALTTRDAAGYAELFDILDGIVRQLSGGTVPYPSTEPVPVAEVRPA